MYNKKLLDSLYQDKLAKDAFIGAIGQLVASPKDINNAMSLIQMIQALDTNKSVRTIKKTIGAYGVTGCDFNFGNAANQTAANIDLGSIVPAGARVLDVFAKNIVGFTAGTSLTAGLGNASDGAQFGATGQTLYALDAIANIAAGSAFPVAPNAAATKIWLTTVTPGANWSVVATGVIAVYVTIIDVTNI